MKRQVINNKEKRRDRNARRRRLNKIVFENTVKDLAAVTQLAFEARAIASPFGLEGPLRHELRSDLCLQGWRWHDADQMARELMDAALLALRAVRPNWNEGQPEWTIESGTLIERTRCARCHGPLPEGPRKFCSSLCRKAFHVKLWRKKTANDDMAVKMATRSI